MLIRQEVHDQYGSDVLDPEDEKIGALEAVFVDDESKEPRFVSIRTGILGTGHAVVPVKKDDLIQGIIRVGYTKQVVHDAPEVEVENELGSEAEEKICRYYDDHERQDPEPLSPPGDILSQREATKDVDPENADFDIPEEPAVQTVGDDDEDGSGEKSGDDGAKAGRDREKAGTGDREKSGEDER